ncbi:basic amino acid/polyamine antiporter [Sinanaerobacter sp. ZZT-01]|uniref:basic amino acid/polyamine antiporter n=1 Tax=Sinanaerobacter sp. ZZT-01 TaxID=3111540 RepID=UPI002D77D418|nr:basic amino acid/polyamine antiporter [Sinanaerobacter sp. ZZT-01]WRR94840.1 basic amino acid/polyamine antiporter [Sinanaerobacter sp. ZZT-01]
MTDQQPQKESKGDLGLLRLTTFAIGTTLASGVFSISGDMAANGANTAAVLVGWFICGIGMLALMLCFYGLNKHRPDLRSGVYSYAREGFGDYIGFNSAWGYWISAMLANVSFATLLFASMGYFFPIFGTGNNLISVICASALIWFTVFLVLRGVSQAATINAVVVIGKILPIMVLIVAIVLSRAFDPKIFMDNFFGEPDGLGFLDQIKATTYTTVWAFVGIEGAVVISARAKKSKDAGSASVISFLCLLAIYIMISVLSMGVLTRGELAELGNPPMAGVLYHVVGTWGATLVNFAVIVSLAGATFSYTILAAESAYAPAAQGCFPKFFASENKKNAPFGSLILSNLIIQVFLIIVLFNESTYQVFYTLSASMIMFPYLLSGMFYLKQILQRHGTISQLSPGELAIQRIIAFTGTIYGAWLLYASGMIYVLITALLYAPGTLVYIWSKKEKGEKAFSTLLDFAILIVILIMFVISAILIANQTIQPF